MTSSSDVVATGTLLATPGVLLGLAVRYTAVAGTLVLRDGGAGGTIKLTLNTPAVLGLQDVKVPGGGIQFDTDIHATLTNVDGVTAFHQ